MEDWLADEDEATQPLPEDGIRQLINLGMIEGLQQGLKTGEVAGYREAFEREASRAALLGRALGAARLINQKTGQLSQEIKQTETACREFWMSDQAKANHQLQALIDKLGQLGVHIY